MAKLFHQSPANTTPQASPRGRAPRKELWAAAIASIIGALAGGGKGAAIGAGTGAGVAAGSEIITKGYQVKVPSETLLDFTLQQSVTIPKHAA